MEAKWRLAVDWFDSRVVLLLLLGDCVGRYELQGTCGSVLVRQQPSPTLCAQGIVPYASTF